MFILKDNLFQEESGFSMLELLIYAAIVSILVIMAVPKFDSAIAAANTARVQADLQTLDSGIAMYYAEKGEYPAALSDLNGYIKNAESVKPPKGKVKIGGTETAMPADIYTLSKDEGEAKLGNYTLEQIVNGSTT